MSGFLLDTNIPSELTRQKPASQVERWLDEANDEELFFSVISLGEILKGLTVLPSSKRRDGLQEWLDGTLRPGLKAASCRLRHRLPNGGECSRESASCREDRSRLRTA